jgi:hypothetical protein
MRGRFLPDRGAAQTWLALKKLRTRASLLMIVAHPDDEDGATLAYESRGLGVRTDLLTLDRGEGGANVMSGDLWDALGLVRSEELLQAGRFYGLDGQYFTTLADYGFSKSLEEALKMWGHDRVLEQAVRVCARDTAPHRLFCLRRRPHRWTWAARNRRSDGAGSLQGRRRSQDVSRSDSGRSSALGAIEGVCTHAPFCEHRKRAL